LRWDDPLVGIVWPMTGQPLLAAKDAAAVGLAEADKFA
jgi:dTDP-4-dehydrorhamnose 3,5-epimerase